MKKGMIAPLTILMVLVFAGCGRNDNAAEPKEDSAQTETVKVCEEAVNEADEQNPSKQNETEEVSGDDIVEIPAAEDVLRFWAENYEDIASGKYTGDSTDCLYISAVDFDADTMPELVVCFSDSKGSNAHTRYLDVDASLTNITYKELQNAEGNKYEIEIPFEPFMMFENNAGEKHYICVSFFSEGSLHNIRSYDDICINGPDESPVVTNIKKIETEYIESDFGEMQADSTLYFDGQNNEISESQYYNEYGIYSYMQQYDMTDIYRVCRNTAYTYAINTDDAEEVYDALSQTYENYGLSRRDTEEPSKALAGRWTLVKTIVDGYETEYDPSMGDITVSFDENTMSLYDTRSTNENIDYFVEYESDYDSEEVWYVKVGDFGEYQWVSFRFDNDGYLNLMGAIKYSETDYGSIYWTFKRCE